MLLGFFGYLHNMRAAAAAVVTTAGAVVETSDYSIVFMPRTEVRCKSCGGHLGARYTHTRGLISAFVSICVC